MTAGFALLIQNRLVRKGNFHARALDNADEHFRFRVPHSVGDKHLIYRFTCFQKFSDRIFTFDFHLFLYNLRSLIRNLKFHRAVRLCR